MRTCAQCGLSVAETATFCPVCGATAEQLGSPAGAETDPVPDGDDVADGAADLAFAAPVEPGPPEALSHRLEEALQALRDAAGAEKADPVLAARLYRVAIILLLEVGDEPLDRADVRRSLLRGFDRLSLVLKRQGLPAEALEESECAASLGLLDCTDPGVKGHREALRKRRVSLRRAADRGSPRR